MKNKTKIADRKKSKNISLSGCGSSDVQTKNNAPERCVIASEPGTTAPEEADSFKLCIKRLPWKNRPCWQR